MRITLVGTGYVGLTTGACFASLGHDVVCVDVLPERVEAINAGREPFYEAGLPEKLQASLTSGRLRATTDLEQAVRSSEVVFIAVGTPEMKGGIDLSYVREASRQIGSVLRQDSSYKTIVVKSTVVPGTTDTLVLRCLEDNSGKRAGEFGLCMNPEFLREGSAVEDFMRPDRIVIGQLDEKSGKALARLYDSFDCPKLFTTLRNAEMIKYASNSLLATLISFSNEIAALCEVTPGTDVKAVLQGLHLDRRLSPVIDGARITPGILSFLWAGAGYGGSCLPKDVNALRAYGHDRNVSTRLLDAVVAVNEDRPLQVVNLAEKALGSLDGANISVLGLAFKPGTDDLRESVALKVIELLSRRGAVVRAYDSIAGPALLKSGQTAAAICMTPEDALQGADAALITTACPEFAQWNWAALCTAMRKKVIVDGRNAFHGIRWPGGVTYLSMGCVPVDGETDDASVNPVALVKGNR